MSSSRKKYQSKYGSRRIPQRHSSSRKLNSKVRRQLLAENCGSINDDDSVDPRTWFAPTQAGKHNHKAWQICRQVADTLQYVLSGTDENHLGDQRLENLEVIAVVPAPDSRRLLVTVGHAVRVPLDAPTVEATLASLKMQIPRLRAEIARSITRRKVPNLSFEYAYGVSTLSAIR